MAKPKNLGDSIRGLLAAGHTYSQIRDIAGVTKSSVAYHAKLIGHVRPPRLRLSRAKRTCCVCGERTAPYKKFCSTKCYLARKRENREAFVSIAPFRNIGESRQRVAVMREQDGRCARCKNDEWMGEPLTLELDHIDGDNQNWGRENLVYLCPNCHSQTKTWRGRNKRGKPSPTRDVGGKSLRRILLDAGLAAKGGNYAVLKGYLADDAAKEERESSSMAEQPAFNRKTTGSIPWAPTSRKVSA